MKNWKYILAFFYLNKKSYQQLQLQYYNFVSKISCTKMLLVFKTMIFSKHFNASKLLN